MEREAESWIFDVRFQLDRNEYRHGLRLHQRHRAAGWVVIGFKVVGALVGIGLLVASFSQILDAPAPGDVEDTVGLLVYGVMLTLGAGGALVWPWVYAPRPVVLADTPVRLRSNESDIEVETLGVCVRIAWPDFWVFQETDTLYVLSRQRMFLVLPKRVVPLQFHRWFYLMAQQSTSPRRDFNSKFPVIIEARDENAR